MEEIYKDIEGYEGLYQVSNLGNVKSLNYHNTKKEKVLKPTICSDGYKRVMLYKNKTIKLYSVHRLVAQAFIENTNNYPCVNHKDESRTNNVVTNLEWCTYKYNTNYGTCIERSAKARINNHNQSKQVYQYNKEEELIAVWESTREAQRNGFDHGAVAACCRNCFNRLGNNVYKGFVWSYEPIK